MHARARARTHAHAGDTRNIACLVTGGMRPAHLFPPAAYACLVQRPCIRLPWKGGCRSWLRSQPSPQPAPANRPMVQVQVAGPSQQALAFIRSASAVPLPGTPRLRAATHIPPHTAATSYPWRAGVWRDQALTTPLPGVPPQKTLRLFGRPLRSQQPTASRLPVAGAEVIPSQDPWLGANAHLRQQHDCSPVANARARQSTHLPTR